AGKTDKAIELFSRIADIFHDEGFTPKAAAVYKKILKLNPEHEPSLLRSAEIAVAQGLLVDARAHLATVEAQRRARGDEFGATQARIRAGQLDPTDYEARLGAVIARTEINDIEGAVRDLKELAVDLVGAGRRDDAVEALAQAAQLAPDDASI